MALQNQDNTRSLGRVSADPHQLALPDLNQNTTGFPSASDLARLWDQSAELSMRASFLKGTTLLPYLHSGTKFEQMLQEMLHRDVKKDEDVNREESDVEERRAIHNGGGPERKVSPDRRREAVRPGEERPVLGVTCRWCSQIFPNVAVLLQHERYLCKHNREAVEMPEGLHRKDHSSPPLFFPRSALPPENNKPSEVTNGLSGNRSPLQKPSWHSVPQQLLVAMHSPTQPRHDALSSRMYWPSHEKGSPSQLIQHSPELTSPRGRRRVPSSGFSSPACLDLASCPPELSSPKKEAGSPWSAQNEPLDLSMPKQHTDQAEKNKTVNGISARGEKRGHGTQQLGRPSPSSHLHLHQHPVFGGAGPPLFPGSLYNGFPLLAQSGVGLSGHDGISPIPFSHTNNSPGFLSPMAYMMEADAELKKIYQERQGLMVSKRNTHIKC